MAAIGKKVAIGQEGHNRQLQLSDLPDEILIHILSLLPTTEDAVRTCLLVLWRNGKQHLWKSLTRLAFRESDMLLKRRRFKNFVDRVMNLCDHSIPLVSFTLQYHKMAKNDYANQIYTWITKAVQFNLEELTLSFGWNSGYITHELPCCIFGCQSLVKLEIVFPFACLSALSLSVICLPRLKYLRLGTVEFTDRESAEKLLSSPLLEELHLECVSWQTFQYISVCSPKLQILKIYEEVDLIFDDPAPCEMRIIADNLKHFSYMGNLFMNYLICASSSTQLQKVEIDVNESMRMVETCFNIFDLLKGLSGATILSLSDFCLEAIKFMSTSRCKVPLFEYVTRLNIRVFKMSICINHWALMKIYEKCPHLEYLNIGKISQTVRSPQLSPIPLCFQTSLKKILIHYYVPGDDEADAAIGVLLNSAFVLEEMVIFCERDDEIGFHEGSCQIQELQDRFNRLPRVSKACVISVRVTYYILFSMGTYYHKCYDKSRSES